MIERTLRIESLENRRMLSVVTVDTEFDLVNSSDNLTSLREAIVQTNNLVGADTIDFDTLLKGKTILLTQGELLIEDDLTVTGPGADWLTIDASGSDPTPEVNNGDGSRIFHMPENDDGTENSLYLSGLLLRGGDSNFRNSIIIIGQDPGPQSGGAIRALGSLSLTDSIVEGNHGYDRGGGVYAKTASGVISIARTNIYQNAISKTAALIDFGNPSPSRGGGAYLETVNGTIHVSDVTAEANDSGAGGGFFIRADGEDAETEIANVTLRLNTIARDLNYSRFYPEAQNFGGGGLAISLDHGANLEFRDSVVGENSVSGRVSSDFLFSDRQNVGGGIHVEARNQSAVEISRVTVVDNQIEGSGGGIGIELEQTATASVEHSTLQRNRASWANSTSHASFFNGGGLYVRGQSDASFSATQVFSANNQADGSGGGGAFELIASEVEIIESAFTGNRAREGGGLSLGGTSGESLGVRLNGVSVTDNYATGNGGGIGQSSRRGVIPTTRSISVSLRIAESLSANNTSEASGGGVFTSRPLTTYDTQVINSTISGNVAHLDGGGVYTQNGLTKIEYSTVTRNLAMGSTVTAAGVATKTEDGTFFPTGSGETVLNHSLVSGNFGIDVGRKAASFGVAAFTSLGFNLVGTANSDWTHLPSDIFDVKNPQIGPLADNGGPTWTHALLAGSPAVDAGDPQALAGFGGVPLTDQRLGLYARVAGKGIDIGGFERQIQHADFDQDEAVDGHDFLAWQQGFGIASALPSDGDADGDANVDASDLSAWKNSHGATSVSAQFYSADFDRNLVVQGSDYLAWQLGYGSADATKADGDANGDTAVDADDLAAWRREFGAGIPIQLAATPLAAAENSVIDLALQAIALDTIQRAADSGPVPVAPLHSALEPRPFFLPSTPPFGPTAAPSIPLPSLKSPELHLRNSHRSDIDAILFSDWKENLGD